MKSALLVTQDKYPNIDAGAVRTHNFAKTLEMIGYASTVVGLGPSTDFSMKEADGIPYISFRSPTGFFVAKLLDRVLFHKRLKKMFLDGKKWDVILTSGVSDSTLRLLKKYSENNRIPLLYDAVEWYSPEQFKFGKFGLAYIHNDRVNRKKIASPMRVIAISSYLDEHFMSRKIASVRIPVIFDVDKTKYDKNTVPEKTVFMYAGSPGKKDYLATIIAGFAQLKDDSDIGDYELRIVGVTKEQLVSLCGVKPEHIDELGDKLKCFGRVPREDVISLLSEADFTVLMRSEELRYAKAGFPTKFVESLATATPVISNLTSDLSLYLKTGVNGFPVCDDSASALANALRHALALSYDERIELQNNARKTAEEQFDYKLYSTVLSEFIK